MLDEHQNELLDNITALEETLEEEDIYSRVMREYAIRHLADIRFFEYSSEYSREFREVNYEWLNESVGVSAYDKAFLENPDEEVIKKGGMIYFAFAGTELAGTVTLLPIDKDKIELTKLAVKKHLRELGIGKKLISFSIEKARELGYNSILLLTHALLKEATGLYQKMGFVKIRATQDLPDLSGRNSITMQLKLNT